MISRNYITTVPRRAIPLCVIGFSLMLLLTGCSSGLLSTGSPETGTLDTGTEGTDTDGDTQSNAFTIEQTLSDEAQRNTIAFDGLAFLTGDLCSDSFLPPGKIADFFGFQCLRDNDPDQMGHNTDFLTRIANNVFYILRTCPRWEIRITPSTPI